MGAAACQASVFFMLFVFVHISLTAKLWGSNLSYPMDGGAAGAINTADDCELFSARSAVLQTPRVHFARLQLFGSCICVCPTVSRTLRVDFARLRPFASCICAPVNSIANAACQFCTSAAAFRLDLRPFNSVAHFDEPILHVCGRLSLTAKL